MHCEYPANLAKLGGGITYDDLEVRYMTECEDWVQMMVASGLGCAVMPRFLPLIDGLLLRPLVEPQVSRQVSMVTVAGRQHSEPVSLALKSAKSLAWVD